MTATTAKGLRYMQGTDPLAQVATIMGLLASDVDKLLPVSGQTNINGSSIASGGIVNTNINFASAFAVAPSAVVAEIQGFVSGSAYVVVRGCGLITTTGFTLSLTNTGAAAATWTGLGVKWTVIP